MQTEKVTGPGNKQHGHSKGTLAYIPGSYPGRLSGTKWGCRASGLLHVHQALVVNKLMYVLPYLDLSSAQMEKMERAHRKGIKTALGVPRLTETKQLLKGTSIIPLEDEATCRLVNQLTRLHLTGAGQDILQQVELRDTTREAKILEALREELHYLQRSLLLTWTPKPRGHDQHLGSQTAFRKSEANDRWRSV